MWQLSKKDGGLSAALRPFPALLRVATAVQRAPAEYLLLGVWRRRVSAHELSRLRAPAVDADAYELRPLDTLLPDAAGLYFECAARHSHNAARAAFVRLAASQAYELLVPRLFLY